MNKSLTGVSPAIALLAGETRAEDTKQAPVWLDSAPLAKRNVVMNLNRGPGAGDGHAELLPDVLAGLLEPCDRCDPPPFRPCIKRSFHCQLSADPTVA
jgi:hypothetical protein